MIDNLARQKTAGVVGAIEAVGAIVWYLPPYRRGLPDLNPIGKMWSEVKAWRRDVTAATLDGVLHATTDALCHGAPVECLNYFRSCGYCQQGCQVP